MNSEHYTADEIMTVVASRFLQEGQVCFVGIGLPSVAANLARSTHAPMRRPVSQSPVSSGKRGAQTLCRGPQDRQELL